jgi:hypothetical protein
MEEPLVQSEADQHIDKAIQAGRALERTASDAARRQARVAIPLEVETWRWVIVWTCGVATGSSVTWAWMHYGQWLAATLRWKLWL